MADALRNHKPEHKVFPQGFTHCGTICFTVRPSAESLRAQQQALPQAALDEAARKIGEERPPLGAFERLP
ncbi:MAG: hypothetical protein ACYDEV_04955 [Acidiferrobacter sp.]